jgi:hypothetical protein
MSHVKVAAGSARRHHDPGASRELATIVLGSTHRTLREGLRLGLIVAICTWAWLALVGAIAGDPFRTFSLLGGVAPFTVVHVLLNIAYALAIVSLIHGAVHEPNLIFALGFGFIMMEFAFAMAAVMFSQVLGKIAWVQIFGGSVVGATIAIILVARTHPLATALRRAQEES